MHLNTSNNEIECTLETLYVIISDKTCLSMVKRRQETPTPCQAINMLELIYDYKTG